MKRRIYGYLKGGILLVLLSALMLSPSARAAGQTLGSGDTAQKIARCHRAVQKARSGRWISTLSGYRPGSSALSALRSAILETERKNCTLGFVLIDIGTARGIAFQPDRLFYSASTIKGPYVASVVCHNPDLQISGNVLVSRTLIYSDNASYNLLVDRYKTAPMRQWFLEAGLPFRGVTQSPYVRFSMYFSPLTLCRLWLRTYTFFQTEKRGKELEKLFQSPNSSAIFEVLSQRYRTDSKAGWYTDGDRRVTNDAGIVYSSSGSYVLALMSTLPADMGALHRLVKVLDEIHQEMTG